MKCPYCGQRRGCLVALYSVAGRLRSRYVRFRLGRLTVWLFPFWWGTDHVAAVGRSWRCLSWVVRPANANQKGVSIAGFRKGHE